MTPNPLSTLEVVLLTRAMDDKCFKLSRQNKGGTFQLSVAGHELVGAVGALSLIPGTDWGLPYYRDRAFALGLGASPVDLFGAFLARQTPHHAGGRMMPDHFVHKELNMPCQSSCVGSQFLHAVGVAKGLQLASREGVVYVSAGDGATSQGDFHEALNFASLHQLGVIFVIQDNGWAISVPKREQTAGGTIAPMARGHGNTAVFEIDGCHFLALTQAFTAAIHKARSGQGPSVIIAQVPRLGPHSNSDDPLKYQTSEYITCEKERDPLPRFEAWLVDQKLITPEQIAQMKHDISKRVEKAALEAEQLPFPEVTTAEHHVFVQAPDIPSNNGAPVGEAVVMVDALNHALHEEMSRDRGIVIFGEDVAHGKGGVFGVTKNLTTTYGVERCFNSPLAESTILGLALGMSLVPPLKPVVEIQFADYLWPGINQLFNEVASFHYRSNGEFSCPLVVRMPYGGYIQGGPYHSQSIEAFLAHCPGLKVVIPSNAADAKRLLKSAIRDPNPVVFLEHKALYRQRLFCARPEPSADDLLPLGVASVVKPGTDITLVGWGMTVFMASEVVDHLAHDGISVELIDLRTIVPFDRDTVLNSVKKTGKLLIAHEAPLFGGFGAEIAAQMADLAFSYLDAPIQRVGGKNCPVPYSKVLEDVVLPQKHDLEKGLRSLALY